MRKLAAQFADHGRTGPLQARLPRLRLGRARPAPRHHRGSRSTGTRMPATRWRCAPGGREAITHWEVLERYPGADGKPVASLLACRLETGRTHQIRVHLAHAGHPLIGDSVYGPGFRTKIARAGAGGRRRGRGPWKTGPACLSLGHRTPGHRSVAGVPLGTTGRSWLVYVRVSVPRACSGTEDGAQRARQIKDLTLFQRVTPT